MTRQVPGAIFLLCTIFLLAFLLRVLPLQEYHGWDESTYLQHAEYIAFGKANYEEFGFRPPLLPLLLAGAFRIWHSPYMADMLVALIAATITIPLFLIGRKLHSDVAGLFAAIIVAVHPAFVTFGHLILTDALVATFLACALLFALGSRWQLFVAGLFAGLAFLMKFTGLGAVPALGLLVLLRAEREVKHIISDGALFTLGVLIVVTPYLLWMHFTYGIVSFFTHAQELVNVVHGGPFYYLHPELFIASLLIGIILYLYYWREHTREEQRLLALSAVWAILIIAYLYKFPNRELRYGLAAIVPLFIVAGIGYAVFAERTKWKGAIPVFMGLILLCSIMSFERLTEPAINHWQEPSVRAAKYIDALHTALPIYATSFYPVYGYYTQNPVVVVDGPYFIVNQKQLMPRDGYLVVYENAEKEPTPSWADAQPFLKKIREEDGILIYAYHAQ